MPITVAGVVEMAGLVSIGTAAFLFLNTRINRTEDRNDDHFKCLDKKVSDINREVGEVKTIVERIEKNGRRRED